MSNAIIRFLSNQRGSAALEYSLLISALAIGMIMAISGLGDTLGALYQTILSGIISIGGGISG